MSRSTLFAPHRARRRPFRLIGFDTEDDGGQIIQACFYGGDGSLERCYHVDDVGSPAEVRRQAMRFLLEELRGRQEVRIAAVNLEYDVMNLAWPEYFSPDVWDVMLVRGRWIYARLKGTNVSFLDLGNHIPQSVLKWGEMLGCPKLEFAPRDPAYCLRDAEIAYRGARFMLDLYRREGGDMRYTAPASALDLFQRRFLRDSFERVDPALLDLYRASYFGGRTEVFRWGKFHAALEQADVKSMYPSIMREPLPNYQTAIACRSIPDSRDYVAEITIEVPDMHVPPLPVRLNDKLIFPVGKVRGVYCRPEIERALEVSCSIERVHQVVRFEDSRPYLRDYSETFYARKRAAEISKDKALERFYKTGLLNSLYGKFGTSGNAERLEWLDSFHEMYDFVEGLSEEPPVYGNVIWSSYICARARAKLHRALCAVKDPVYCDTDGVIFASSVRAAVDVPCSDEIAYGSEMGDWEFKGHYDRGEFWRAKAYAMTGHGGSSKDGVAPATHVVHVRGVGCDYADKILEEAEVFFSAPLRYREAIRRGARPNEWVQRKKTLDREYDKRVVLRGGRTEAIRL